MKLNAPLCDASAIIDSRDGDLTAEVRHQIRYPLRVPVSFTWFSGEGTPRSAKGTSLNIGEGGAYILTRNSPPVSAQITLVFRFPHLPDFARFHRLEMGGRVVRAEVVPNGKGLWGFAVASAWTVMAENEDSDREAGDAE